MKTGSLNEIDDANGKKGIGENDPICQRLAI